MTLCAREGRTTLYRAISLSTHAIFIQIRWRTRQRTVEIPSLVQLLARPQTPRATRSSRGFIVFRWPTPVLACLCASSASKSLQRIHTCKLSLAAPLSAALISCSCCMHQFEPVVLHALPLLCVLPPSSLRIDLHWRQRPLPSPPLSPRWDPRHNTTGRIRPRCRSTRAAQQRQLRIRIFSGCGNLALSCGPRSLQTRAGRPPFSRGRCGCFCWP